MADRTRAATGATGRAAEDAALRWLECRGLRLLTRNFRSPFGELDLVMADRQVAAIIEVRYRRNAARVDPVETVTVTKRRRMLRTTSALLVEMPALRRMGLRFDVLAVSGDLGNPRFDWLRGAFDASDIGGWRP